MSEDISPTGDVKAFLTACDALAETRHVKRSTVSKWLFNDTNRLDDLARGTSEPYPRTLRRARADLEALQSGKRLAARLRDRPPPPPDKAAQTALW